MKTQTVKLLNNASDGATKNKRTLALTGIKISLKSSLTPSAIAWPIPYKPVIAGPLRRCIEAIILRSATVKNAIDNKLTITVIKISNIVNFIIQYRLVAELRLMLFHFAPQTNYKLG